MKGLRHLGGKSATPLDQVPVDMAVPPPLLSAATVTAGYFPGVDILNACSLDVNKGELVGIVGPNGAGKSTLLKALFGLLQVRSGQVLLRGEDVTGRSAPFLVSAGVGYVPQVANVFAELSVEENLRMGVYRNPKLFDERYEKVVELFPLLAERTRQRAGLMSGGERQMVAMGRGLMMNPEVLLLDEPSAGLSPANQSAAFERIKQIHNSGVSIIIVEQNARRCLQICDRAYVLDQGRNAYEGTGRSLLADPKVVELYLGTSIRR